MGIFKCLTLYMHSPAGTHDGLQHICRSSPTDCDYLATCGDQLSLGHQPDKQWTPRLETITGEIDVWVIPSVGTNDHHLSANPSRTSLKDNSALRLNILNPSNPVKQLCFLFSPQRTRPASTHACA